METSAHIDAGHPFFDIIEQAYRVFASPKPTDIGVCKQCCMDPAIEADFFNPDIRELPLIHVRDWYNGACAPNGVPQETWRYLLPRILEILAAGEDVCNTALEVSLRRFATGKPENWSPHEWAVLDRFQRTYLHQQIDSGEHFLDDVICMFALGGWPLAELLLQVASVSDRELAQRLWRDWCSWSATGQEDVWITAFWDEPNKSTVFEFYTSQDCTAEWKIGSFGRCRRRARFQSFGRRKCHRSKRCLV